MSKKKEKNIFIVFKNKDNVKKKSFIGVDPA